MSSTTTIVPRGGGWPGIIDDEATVASMADDVMEDAMLDLHGVRTYSWSYPARVRSGVYVEVSVTNTFVDGVLVRSTSGGEAHEYDRAGEYLGSYRLPEALR